MAKAKSKRKGRSAAFMKSLRKRFKLGEFAPKRGRRLAKRRARQLATVSAEARHKRVDALEVRDNILEGIRQRSRRRDRTPPPVMAGQPQRGPHSTPWSVG